MSSTVALDGRQGEGGGQILRSGLTLSAITGRPLQLGHIRGGRKRPGLMRQHLACVRALAEITGAEVSGDALGSKELSFAPGAARAGQYRFAIGSAGSTGLVLQTVLVPLLLADGPSELVLEGGTHNSMAPPFHALKHSFAPLVEAMGGRLQLNLERAGFYPAGGGRLLVQIEPPSDSKPLDLTQRGPKLGYRASIDYAHIPDSIPAQQAKLLFRALPILGENIELSEHPSSLGPGCAMSVHLDYRNVSEVWTVFGSKGVSSKRLIRELTKTVKQYLVQPAPVGSHLADQLLLPMVALGGGRFRSMPPTPHTTTNIQTIQAFLGPDCIRIDEDGEGCYLVRATASLR